MARCQHLAAWWKRTASRRTTPFSRWTHYRISGRWAKAEKKSSTLWLPFYFPQFEGNKKFQHCFFRISTPSAQSMCTVAWRCWEDAWGGTFCLFFLPTSVAASSLPSSRFFLLSLPGGQAIQALAENQQIAKILIPQQEKDQKVENSLFPARTQPQSPERTSILIIEAANTLPRFFSRPSQVTETRQKL